MKKLLITLMLVSPFSFADWGDVYYCQETTYSKTTLEGKRTDYMLEKFTFKLDKTKNAIAFGKDGFFHNLIVGLAEGRVWPAQESWWADDSFSMLYFDTGKFLYVSTGPSGNYSISADCDKF